MYAIPRPTFSERGLLFVGMMGGMPATIARMLMCFGVLIVSVLLYMPVLIALIDQSEVTAFVLAGVVSCITFAAGWTLVWRCAIEWTPHRVIFTLLLLPCGMVPAGICYVIGESIIGHSNGTFGAFLGTLAWAASWLIGSALIWRENARERGERLRRLGIHAVACPDCGYNLTGLKEAKCPECGAAYTLDQLYASIAEQRAELGGD